MEDQQFGHPTNPSIMLHDNQWIHFGKAVLPADIIYW